jgi:hypothetical protein
MRKKFTPNLLLVEGKDDLHVIRNLWLAQGESIDAFGIEWPQGNDPESGGKGALLAALPVQLRREQLERLGIVLDADESPESAWYAVTNRLRDEGYSVPSRLDANGLVLDHPTDDGPRVGVWLMPDNSLPGKVEDFVRMLIPAGDELAVEADGALKVIEGKDVQRYAVKDRPKAFIHTWLAWQDEPGRPMGAAITRQYLDPISTQAERFVAWLRRLFLEE